MHQLHWLFCSLLKKPSGMQWKNNQEHPRLVATTKYKLLMERTDAYKVLTKFLIQFNQSGAAKILIRVPTELFSNPLTYLDLSTELKSFENVNIEVIGKTHK